MSRSRMGNTTMSTVTVWPMRIEAVDTEERTVRASCSSNSVCTYAAYQGSKWRMKRPDLVQGPLGNYRLAKRGEKVGAV